MTDRKVPKNLREKYLDERSRLYQLVWTLEEAITSLASGNVASYSLGNRSVSYQNLAELRAMKRDLEERIDELEGILSGRPRRNITVSTFLSPSIMFPRR